MSGAGTPDFFYREAHRLGYVARSAFKLLQMQKQYKLITPGASVLDLGCAPGAWLQASALCQCQHLECHFLLQRLLKFESATTIASAIFLMVACQSLGPLKNGGIVVGVDLKKVKVPSLHCDSRVRTVCADVMNLVKDQARALSPQCKGFSVVLSDMCPAVSGITTKDAALSMELGMQALALAVGRAVLNGSDDHGEERSDGSASGVDDDGVLQLGGNLVIKLLESEDVQGFSKICKSRFRKASLLRPKATRSSSREIYLICQGLR
ncbi:uncharacterized protein LOC131252866 isoform X1 [Magnolia sinica]|uniref:uncharacterized protein LOC131252866 isoform X1 n=1 Tax=Magnolia sinica TaxID=86752 RepID=UPI002659CF81|nr:uncharacterized protein LOC131252866 isoform X1 [Magnolia sinica]